MKIKIILPGQKPFVMEIEKGLRAEEVLTKLPEKPAHQIYGCNIDGYAENLNFVIEEECTLRFLDITDPYGNMAMQSSLVLLYLKAVHDILGKEIKVSIANSLSKGVFTIIHGSPVSEETTRKIENRMQELVKKNLPISEKEGNRRQILQWLKQKNRAEELSLYESAPDISGGMICALEEEEDLLYYHAVPKTGYLNLFELKKYRNGILLRFPHPSSPDLVLPFEEQRLLYEAFSEENHWEKLCGISLARDLNQAIEKGQEKELIALSEALHEKKIAEIAEMIHHRGKRIILIAGPSSSGKTSFAKRLCIQLRVIGLKPLYLGTDDYFIDRKDLPVGPDGKKDLESLHAVDINLFTSQMNDLLAGKKVDLPTFEFVQGIKEYGKRITSIEAGQPIVIEGIHALNPALTEDIPEDVKFRIYISPLTQLNLDEHHRVPTTDARMLRRLVRDYRTRGRSAAETSDDWPSVRAGEEVNIFPYNSQADVFFNSQAIYELAVLKKYAEPLLKGIKVSQPEYSEAQRMLEFLSFFVPLKDESCIANNSIVREFIGGSVLVS